MRTLLQVKVPVEAGNRAVRDGEMARVVQQTLERLQPEAVYFVTMGGQRAMLVVFDMESPADMPPIAEPLFNALGASIEFQPCMNADDLRAGLASL